MAKSSKKHGATKQVPLSPLERAFWHYEAGDVVAARAQAQALTQQTSEESPAEAALVAKLWPSPLPSPLPSRKAVAQALATRTKSPPLLYAYALLGVVVALFLGLVAYWRS